MISSASSPADGLDHATADLGHPVRLVVVDDRDRHARIGGEVARLARARLGEEGDPVALERIQTGTLCGAPLGRTVATWAKFARWNSARTLSGSSAMPRIVAWQDAAACRSRTRSAPPARAWRARRARCGSSTPRSPLTRGRCRPSRRRRPTSRPAHRTRSARPSGCSSTPSTSARAGSRRCASRRASPASAPSRPGLKARGPWSAEALTRVDAAEAAATFGGQDPEHELMALFARALRELGAHVLRAARRLLPRARALRRRLGRGARRAAREPADLARRLALRRRAACRSSSAPSSPPPTCTCRASRRRPMSPR